MYIAHSLPDRDILQRVGLQIAAHALEHDRDKTLDRVSWDALTQANLWRISVAPEYGGLGLTWKTCVECIDEVARHCEDLGFLITMLGHVGSIKLLNDYGTPEQKDRWIPRLLQGEIAVTAMTESTGGSDLSKMRLSAVKTPDGYQINGRKRHITNSPVATMGMIAGRMADLPDKKDITLFFLDFNQAGISIGEEEDNLGIRTSPTADIQFERTPISAVNVVGTAGDGLSILYRIISFERALYGVIAAGLIDGIAAKGMQRVTEQEAFGKPLADFQYIQARLSDMKMGAVICRTLAYESLKLLDTEDSQASIVCSVTKFQAGESLFKAAEDIVQIYGHQGFMNNTISKYLRDASGMRIAGGTSDIQRINIFNQMRRQAKAGSVSAPYGCST